MSDVASPGAGVPPMHPKASSAAIAAAAAAAAAPSALPPTAPAAEAQQQQQQQLHVSAPPGMGAVARGSDSQTSSRASASASASRASSASSSVTNSPSTAFGSLAAPSADNGSAARSPALSSRARPFPQSLTHTATPVAPAAAAGGSSGSEATGDAPETATSAARNDQVHRNLQQLALQNSGAKSEQLQTSSFSPGIGRRSVKIASSTFLKPSPGFRTRTLSKANESAALFPKFHYLPSLGLGVGANIDNNSKATSAFAGADQQYHFIDSPLLTAQQKLGSGLPPEHSVATAGGGRWIHPVMGVGGNGASSSGGNGNGGTPQSDNDSPGGTPTPSSTSASPGSLTHTLQTQAQRSSASASSGAPMAGTGSPLTGSSPGVGVRRLAEQFLNSISDDSPAVRPRRIGLGKHATTVTPSAHVPTLPTELKRDKSAATSAAASSTVVPAGEAAVGGEAAPKEGVEGPKTPDQSAAASSSSGASAAAPDASAAPSPTSSPSSSEEWAQLHADILKFSDSCAADSARQKRLREELVQRTQWSIRCVWPTAHVDLVGSVAAGVCLPKSDLDFVVRFPPSATPPPSYSYATAAQSNAQGGAPGQAAAPTNYTYSTPLPVDPSAAQQDADGASGSPPPTVQHFAQASTLIKLIGGRKKSKLLFRSTKIQVFKDINLIRLRDGCSGISMDLWFPVDPAMLTRSQQHTLLIHKMLSDFPHSFYPLAIVLKSFMAQNLLNSGYSGLGSYGVLLMLIRFLQYERSNAQRDGRPEETNLGKLLVGFFRLYATFDYIHHAIDVVNIPDDGGFIDKPDVLIVARVRKPTASAGPGSAATPGKKGKKGGGGGDDSDDEDEFDHAPGLAHHDDSESGGEESHVASVVVGAGAGGSALGSRESASLKKKRSNAADRFTLLIRDPMDAQNQIICHHKALRNMIGAFIRAIVILDPSDRPAPALMLPPTPVVPAGGAADEQGVGGVDGLTPALSAVGPGVDPATASAPPSVPGTPVLIAQPMQSLPSFPGLAATANIPDASRFHRLIEVNAARLGPQTKPCTSAQCLNPDGSSQTMCPIQNKVCFTCGHLFVKAGGGGGGSASSAAPTPVKSGAKHPPTAVNGIVGGQTVRHLSTTTAQSQLNQHRSPPMQGQHQRNYNLGRQPNQQQLQHQQQQQQQQPSPQPMQTQQQMLNAQALLAAQQILSQQLASQSQAAAPLMYFNLQTQQVEMMAPPSSHLAPTFIPVMGYNPAMAFGAPAMYGAMQGGGSGMEGQVAAQVQLQTLMASLQQQQQQQQLSAVTAAAAAAAAANQQQQQFNAMQQQYAMMAQGAQQQMQMQPSMYSGSATSGGQDLGGYMGGQSYGVNPTLSYDGLSPLYTTRTLSDPLQSVQQQSDMNLGSPPSPPTRLRSSHSTGGPQNGRNGNGAAKPSSRATRSNNFQQQQQQPYYAQQQQQQQAYQH